MLATGRTLRRGLTACGSSAPPSHSATVNLAVNGAYSVNKPAGTSTFSPFELRSYKLQVYTILISVY